MSKIDWKADVTRYLYDNLSFEDLYQVFKARLMEELAARDDTATDPTNDLMLVERDSWPDVDPDGTICGTCDQLTINHALGCKDRS